MGKSLRGWTIDYSNREELEMPIDKHRSLANKGQASAATTGANQTTGITLGSYPAGSGKNFPSVYLNGIYLETGDAVKTKDFYFSRDAGVSALGLSQLKRGDTLYWTKAREAYNLGPTDLISIDYDTTGV